MILSFGWIWDLVNLLTMTTLTVVLLVNLLDLNPIKILSGFSKALLEKLRERCWGLKDGHSNRTEIFSSKSTNCKSRSECFTHIAFLRAITYSEH